MLTVSEAWKNAYAGAMAGILVMHNVQNPARHPELNERRDDVESNLRTRFANLDRGRLKRLEPISNYNAYFKRYKKTYPVQLQLESVVFKGQSIPSATALVQAMFMAELKNLLLTAGHDVEALRLPVRLDVATGEERYIRLNGEEQALKSGDMIMADGQGVISSVIYGPDQRTRIHSGTTRVLFAVYGVPGIAQEAIYQHLQDIQSNVRLVAPGAQIEALAVYGTE